MIGGSFGTAVFGAIFANLLVGKLEALPGPVAARPTWPARRTTRRRWPSSPPAIHDGVVEAVAHTVDGVPGRPSPIGLVAFLLSWLLPEVELRKTMPHAGPAEACPCPTAADVARGGRAALRAGGARENRAELYRSWPPGPASTSAPGLLAPLPALDEPGPTHPPAPTLEGRPRQDRRRAVGLVDAGLVEGPADATPPCG